MRPIKFWDHFEAHSGAGVAAACNSLALQSCLPLLEQHQQSQLQLRGNTPQFCGCLLMKTLSC